MNSLGEFDLIRRYFVRPELQTPYPASQLLALGPGDDCALLEVPHGQQLAVSADTFVTDVHFFANMPADRIASRCMAASLSDLAAMGATPAWFTLCLTLPEQDHTFLQAFSDGLIAMVKQYAIVLAGGDTTRGPLCISLQVMGWVPTGQGLTRLGAKVGDNIYVSGTLGDAGAGLQRVQADGLANGYLAQRFYQPTARISLGQWLRQKASAAIDLSDGLLQDLSHILRASNVGAKLNCDKLPISKELQKAYDWQTCQKLAMSGGEDFELCFTLPRKYHEALLEFAQQEQLIITQVGTITAETGLRLFRHDSAIDMPDYQGWQHF